MVKTIVALLLSLLVLVGPASAQEPDPPSEEPAAEQPPSDDGAPDGSGEPTTQDANSSALAPTTTRATYEGERASVCRALVTHIADPHMSPNRWVIMDPDGCVRRTVERLIGPATRIAFNLL